MNFRPVFHACGVLLLVLAVAMFLPMVADLMAGHSDWRVFAGAQICTTYAGFMLVAANTGRSANTATLRETFLLTALAWVLLAAFAALPFCFSALSLSPAAGFFEALSGLTTTGMTAISGLDALPPGILLWRALLHWLGGIGGLVSALVILPFLRVGGQHAMRAHSPDAAKVLPSASQMAAWICIVYIGMTWLCAFLLGREGIGGFDAMTYAMSAVSTGGFSVSDSSLAKFQSVPAEATLMVFMLLGSLPYTLYLRMLRGDLRAALEDRQVRSYLCFIAAAAMMLAVYLVITHGFTFAEALRHAALRAVALSTSSGLTLRDDDLWGGPAAALFFALAFIGGCSASTTGGIRVFRLGILMAAFRQQLRRLIEPSGVFRAHSGGRVVDTEILHAVCVFVLAYLFLVFTGGALLSMLGLGAAEAFTTAFAAVSNTGAAINTEGSRLADFAAAQPGTLWVVSGCMLLGRLEILTVFVLFAPRFWRR